jgi:signal transduction histidine kinase/ActR/RegA family two-component response regulator
MDEGAEPNTGTGRLQARALARVDGLLPPRVLADPVDLQRARLLVLILWFTLAIAPLNLIPPLLHGQYELVGASCAATTFHIAVYLWLVRTGAVRSVANFFVAGGFVMAAGLAFTEGGTDGYAAAYLVSFPVFAMTLLNARAALAWGALTALFLGGIGLADGALPALPSLHGGQGTSPALKGFNFAMAAAYVAAMSFFLDHSNRLRQDQLERERARADRASAAKSAFLANISHELRTPMNGVLGLTEVLAADPRITPDQLETLSLIQGSGRALVQIINDLLDLSKLEASRVDLERIPSRPGELADEVLELLRQSAAEKQLQVRRLPSPAWEAPASLDPCRLRQILLNLVGNAIKFTSTGVVELTLSREGEVLRFEVRDTGIGIDPEDTERLFRPFEQADASTTRRFGGTGLGLSICTRLAHLMGGEIGARGALGRGATFWFTIRAPAARLEDAAAAPSCAVTQAELRVLVVEDDKTNQLVTERMLGLLGHEVTVVEDGELALEALWMGDFDAVLMDRHMPVLDGLEATRRARESGVQIPIYILSASAMGEEKALAAQAGADDFIAKPVSMATLARILATVTPLKQAG